MALKLVCAVKGCLRPAAMRSNYCTSHQEDELPEVWRARRDDDSTDIRESVGDDDPPPRSDD